MDFRCDTVENKLNGFSKTLSFGNIQLLTYQQQKINSQYIFFQERFRFHAKARLFLFR